MLVLPLTCCYNVSHASGYNYGINASLINKQKKELASETFMNQELLVLFVVYFWESCTHIGEEGGLRKINSMINVPYANDSNERWMIGEGMWKDIKIEKDETYVYG